MSAKPKSQTRDSKEKKQQAVSKAVLEIVELHGLTGITHSKVSRRSGVSRGWIYEYIGSEKEDLVKFSTEAFAQKFARVGNALPDQLSALRKQLDDDIKILFDCAMSDPVIIQIYFRFRGTANPIGKIIGEYEAKWLTSAAKKLEDVSKLPKDQCLRLADLMVALRTGACHRIVTAVDSEAARKAAEKTFSELHAFVEGAKQSTEISI